jgi:hypothetical protein
MYCMLAGLLVFGLNACQKQPLSPETDRVESLNAGKANPDKINIFKGPVVHMGDGKVRSWISVSHDGVPQEIGLEITEQGLFGLPTDPHDFAASTYVLPLHHKAKTLTAFDHITINWEPQGHEPPGVFDIPHFDFHFYMTTHEYQMAIPDYTVATAAAFDNLPPVSARPPLYIAIPGGVATMGKHWISTTFTPPFVSTLIYGSYEGKFTFVEPMITRAFLLGGASFSAAYPQLQQFPVVNRYYPTKYNIYRDPTSGSHYVTLSEFVWR